MRKHARYKRIASLALSMSLILGLVLTNTYAALSLGENQLYSYIETYMSERENQNVNISDVKALENLDEENAYICAKFNEGGYAIIHAETMKMSEYTLSGDVPFDWNEPRIIYAGPGNYFVPSEWQNVAKSQSENYQKIRAAEDVFLEDAYQSMQSIASDPNYTTVTHSVSFQVGQTAVEVDGASYEIPEMRDGFRLSQEDSPLAVAEEYGPVITAGTFYVPSDLIPAQCPSFGLNNLLEYPQTNMIIIGRIEREFGFDDIRLYDIFADLPEEVRSQYDLAGSAGHVLNYSISEYQSETTHVYVMNVDEGTEDVEQMDGRICAIYVDSPGPQTPRGLQVGEGIDRAWLLYGHASMTNSFRYTVSGSFITSLSFCTRYFSI